MPLIIIWIYQATQQIRTFFINVSLVFAVVLYLGVSCNRYDLQFRLKPFSLSLVFPIISRIIFDNDLNLCVRNLKDSVFMMYVFHDDLFPHVHLLHKLLKSDMLTILFSIINFIYWSHSTHLRLSIKAALNLKCIQFIAQLFLYWSYMLMTMFYLFISIS